MLKSKPTFYYKLVEKRFLYTAIFILILILITNGIEFLLFNKPSQWLEDITRQREENFKKEINDKFISYQKDLLNTVELIVNRPDTKNSIQNKNQVELFSILNLLKLQNTEVDIYDKDGLLIAWVGSGTELNGFNPIDTTNFKISKSLIYSWLVLNHPIKQNEKIIGYIIAKKILDYNFPISNRFISADLHRQTFSNQLSAQVNIYLNPPNNISDDENLVTVPLSDISNRKLAYIQFHQISTDDVLFEFQNILKYIKTFLSFILSIIILSIFISYKNKKLNNTLGLIFILVLFWLVRYFWLLIDFPSVFSSSSIFNPKFFASNFGYGISKSIAELFITSILLIISIRLINRSIIYQLDKNGLGIKSDLLKYLIALFILILFTITIRGYLAIIVSTVQDSNLDYLRPDKIFPDFETFVMILSLLFITLSFSILVSLCIKVSEILLFNNIKVIKKYLILLAYFMSGIILFVIIHPNPLYNIYFGFALVLLFLLNHFIFNKFKLTQSEIYIFSIKTVLPAVLILSVSFYTQINIDRQRLLVNTAQKLTQPFDDWLAFVVDEALNQVEQDLQKNLEAPERSEYLAFDSWAKSILSKTGYDCNLKIYNPTLNIISEFQIGNILQENDDIDSIPKKRTISLKEISDINRNIKYYSGSLPFFDPENRLTAVVKLDVFASRFELFETDATDILRTKETDKKYFYFPNYYNEYRNGVLRYTTNPEFPRNLKLSNEIVSQITEKNYTFTNEILYGKIFESVYIRQPEEDLIIGLSTEIPTWYKFNFLRLVFYLSIISLIFYSISKFYTNRYGLKFTFFTKLLTAFIIVSLLPLLIFSYYNNRYSEERAAEIIKNNLKKETELIAQNLYGDTYSNLDNKICRKLKVKFGIDFIFYDNHNYKCSSIPELIKTELISKRISNLAYKEIIFNGKNFFLETQNIGRLYYYVGYTPLISRTGEILGIISVSAISKIGWIESETWLQNVYMLGIYTIILCFVLIIGVLLSNQISKPLKNLVYFTRIVAEGNLDKKINSKRSDEIGKLEAAFDEMTGKIKQQQEDLRRYEKEMAWKEMAKQVAHEIKNPLTPIKLSVQHLYQAYKDRRENFGDILRKVIDMISEQIEVLSNIASEFSSFARMPSGKMEIVSVNELLDETVNVFYQYPNITIIKEFYNENLFIKADRAELRRAFINIIKNSVQAIRDTGEIKIITDKRENKIIIKIEDTGVGIPDEIASKIFEPNFSTKTEGMGLGLAIVKKTIEELKGEIKFKTKPGTGTTFEIILNEERHE